MRRIAAGLVILLLAAAVLGGATGCGQEKQAQELIKSANPNVQKGNQLVEQLRETWAKIQNLPDSPAGYKQGVKLGKAGSSQSTGAKDEYQKAVGAIDKARKLDISEQYRKYMGLKRKAFEVRIQALQLSADRFDQIANLYAAANARDIKKWKLAKAKIAAISAKIAKLPDSDKLDEAADAYGKKNNIGE